MELIPLHVQDAYIVQYKMHSDHRGYLTELFNEESYPAAITDLVKVKQVTFVKNKKHALRGIHISPYSKLLSCVQGSIYDVVVDLRPESSSYMLWAGVFLSQTNCRQLLIPPNCGHAYLSLEEDTMVLYSQLQEGWWKETIPGMFAQTDSCKKTLGYAISIFWNFRDGGGCFGTAIQKAASVYDPQISIPWPLPAAGSELISPQDKDCPNLDVPGISPNRKRVLVIGASGQLGGSLMGLLKSQSDRYIAIGTSFTHNRPLSIPFDLETAVRNPDSVKLLLDACMPHVVIISAAYTSVDKSESEKVKAKTILVDSIKEIVTQCKVRKIKVVSISSNYVYDQKCSKHSMDQEVMQVDDVGIREELSANPPNTYGDLKLMGEQVALATDPNILIVRTSRIYGPEMIGKNFVYQVVNSLSAGKEMKCLTDEICNVTYNRDLARALMKLVEDDCSGLYHICGPQAMSKYFFALKVAKYFNLDSSLLIPLSSDKLALPAQRPKFAVLSSQKFRSKFPRFKFHSLEESLDDWKDHPFGKQITFP